MGNQKKVLSFKTVILECTHSRAEERMFAYKQRNHPVFQVAFFWQNFPCKKSFLKAGKPLYLQPNCPIV